MFTVPKEELHSRMLKFTVCDFDRFSRQQVIGHVLYQLPEAESLLVVEDFSEEIWMDIGEDVSKVMSLEEKGGGGGSFFMWCIMRAIYKREIVIKS